MGGAGFEIFLHGSSIAIRRFIIGRLTAGARWMTAGEGEFRGCRDEVKRIEDGRDLIESSRDSRSTDSSRPRGSMARAL
jgi:hypothetical protein